MIQRKRLTIYTNGMGVSSDRQKLQESNGNAENNNKKIKMVTKILLMYPLPEWKQLRKESVDLKIDQNK